MGRPKKSLMNLKHIKKKSSKKSETSSVNTTSNQTNQTNSIANTSLPTNEDNKERDSEDDKESRREEKEQRDFKLDYFVRSQQGKKNNSEENYTDEEFDNANPDKEKHLQVRTVLSKNSKEEATMCCTRSKSKSQPGISLQQKLKTKLNSSKTCKITKELDNKSIKICRTCKTSQVKNIIDQKKVKQRKLKIPHQPVELKDDILKNATSPPESDVSLSDRVSIISKSAKSSTRSVSPRPIRSKSRVHLFVQPKKNKKKEKTKVTKVKEVIGKEETTTDSPKKKEELSYLKEKEVIDVTATKDELSDSNSDAPLFDRLHERELKIAQKKTEKKKKKVQRKKEKINRRRNCSSNASSSSSSSSNKRYKKKKYTTRKQQKNNKASKSESSPSNKSNSSYSNSSENTMSATKVSKRTIKKEKKIEKIQKDLQKQVKNIVTSTLTSNYRHLRRKEERRTETRKENRRQYDNESNYSSDSDISMLKVEFKEKSQEHNILHTPFRRRQNRRKAKKHSSQSNPNTQERLGISAIDITTPSAIIIIDGPEISTHNHPIRVERDHNEPVEIIDLDLIINNTHSQTETEAEIRVNELEAAILLQTAQIDEEDRRIEHSVTNGIRKGKMTRQQDLLRRRPIVEQFIQPVEEEDEFVVSSFVHPTEEELLWRRAWVTNHPPDKIKLYFGDAFKKREQEIRDHAKKEDEQRKRQSTRQQQVFTSEQDNQFARDLEQAVTNSLLASGPRYPSETSKVTGIFLQDTNVGASTSTSGNFDFLGLNSERLPGNLENETAFYDLAEAVMPSVDMTLDRDHAILEGEDPVEIYIGGPQGIEQNEAIREEPAENNNDEEENTSSNEEVDSDFEHHALIDQLEDHQRYRDYPVAVQLLAAVDSVDRAVLRPIPQLIYLGAFALTCPACNAFAFACEPHSANGNHRCCQRGKVVKPPRRELPNLLRYLLTNQNEDARNFRENMVSYNSAFSMASFPGHKAVRHVGGRGPIIFKVQGECYHTVHPADPQEERQRVCGQLYFLDPHEANERRGTYHGVRAETINQLNDMLHQVNPLVQTYRTMREILRRQEAEAARMGEELPRFYLAVTNAVNVHPGRANLPTVSEVAVVFEGEDPPARVQLRVYPRDGILRTLRHYDPICLAMTFVFFHVYGEVGHTIEERHEGVNRTATRNRITFCDSYAYLVFERPDYSPIFDGGRLFQRYVVALYCAVESDNLRFIRQNQASLRSDTLDNLTDFVNNHAQRAGVEPGRIVILPGTYVGSPRHMQRLYLNAMAVVQKLGKPDLFITFTCNPQWREVQENLHPGQHASDRPDLLVRVFYEKLKILKRMIIHGKIFGEVDGFIHSVEHQKRGLPHAHIVIFLKPAYKISTPDHVDRVVKAYLPADANEELKTLVKNLMLHGPCGPHHPAAPCMMNDKGTCSKHYPMPFEDVTLMDNGTGRPTYKRPNNGSTLVKGDTVFTNRDIVPYNEYLLRAFQAHINVEVCTSYKCIKYLFKYIFKGYDALTLHTNIQGGRLNWDEVSFHQASRYVTACEAIIHLCKMKVHSNMHAVLMLPIHLAGRQHITYRRGEAGQAAQRGDVQLTMFTAWFAINNHPVHGPLARTLHYWQMPNRFAWEDGIGCHWRLRRRRFNTVIARVKQVNPAEEELSHLRTLAMNVVGALSHEWFYSFEDIRYPTYKDVCRARNFLQDDVAYIACLREAALTRRPRALRLLFAHLLYWTTIADGGRMFEMFEADFTQDLRRHHRGAEVLRARALLYIARLHDRLNEQHPLHLRSDMLRLFDNEVVRQQRELLAQAAEAEEQDVADEQEGGAEQDVGHVERPIEQPQEERLNLLQRQFFDEVLACIQQQVGTIVENGRHLFYLQGAGGTGKTYLYNTLVQAVHRRGLKCVTMAWTGIASLLLPNGTTCHYALGLPLDLNAQSSSSIKFHDPKATLLREASLILWDEAPMGNTHALTILNSTLQMVMDNNLLFGGKLVILGGDLRQLMPVVVNATHHAAAIQSVCKNRLWRYFTRRILSVNLRAGPGEAEFAAYLQNVGDGRHERMPGLPETYMRVPDAIIVNKRRFIASVFEGNPVLNAERRAILCPTNAAADEINSSILNSLPGQIVAINSVDSADPQGRDDVFMPIEFMNSLNPPGLPPFCLKLKVGATVMLLRNINLSEGLCNGTRLRVISISPQLLTCLILSGPQLGTETFLPRIELKCSNNNTPTPFIRTQFPVKLAFAMTINKSQGQTFERIGLYLNRPVFTHGQMYVALSRVSSMRNLSMYIEPSIYQGIANGRYYTANIVNAAVVQEILEAPNQ